MALSIQTESHRRTFTLMLGIILQIFFLNSSTLAQSLLAGTGKSNITKNVENIHDLLYVKVLVLKNNNTSLAIITLDVISIGVIGGIIPDDYYDNVKETIKNKYHIKHILVSASHNHWDGFLLGEKYVVDNVEEKTMQAVRKALNNLEPVQVGAGTGSETRIAMNRRIKLKDGSVYTIRHANPNMPDDEVIDIGNFDPEIGILRIDRLNGTSKAVLYNYACHPYTGTPEKSVTAEYPGAASKEIESILGNGTMAFFLQGAAGDITEVLYKDIDDIRDCTLFGLMLGSSTLKGLSKIKTSQVKNFKIISRTINLPLRKDVSKRIKKLEEQETELLASLRSTSLNIKAFIPLYIKYKLAPEYPSYYSYRYFEEKALGLKGLKAHDKENRKNIEKYLKNMRAMDKLSQIQENKFFLKRKQQEIDELKSDIVSVAIEGIRIGDFVVVTFPGEPFAQVGLNIKENSPFENTFIAGYSNGYIHYAPTADSYKEWGYEVMNCIIAPEWQSKYENEISEILEQLK